jgi:molybdenum-dependent DNA-binding transcriptional regulator ModE
MAVNKHGHDKDNPRLELASGHLPSNPTVYGVYQLFKVAVVRLYRQPNLFPSLARTSTKKKRTDRMEAICLTLLASSVCMDIRSLLIAIPEDEIKRDSWLGRSITKLAEIAGLSYSRCKRAILDMRAASFIGVWRVTNEVNGRKVGRPSLRRLGDDLLKALDIWRPFEKLRKLYCEWIKRDAAKDDEAGQAKLRMAYSGKARAVVGSAIKRITEASQDWRERMLREYMASHAVLPDTS